MANVNGVERKSIISHTEHRAKSFRSRTRSVGELQLLDVLLSPPGPIEVPSEIRRTDPRYGKAGFVIEGRMIVGQDGTQAELGAGDFLIHRVPYPLELVAATQVRLIGVTFPLRMLPVPGDRRRMVTVTGGSGHLGSGALLASLLYALSSSVDSVLPQEEAGISSAMGGLLTALIARSAADGSAEDIGSPTAALTARIRRFIECEMADPGLNPASVAAAHHISIRQLHRLFEHEKITVTELIRTSRLEGCRRDLIDPVLHLLPIGAVAERWGITSSAKFSRMFRAAYGMSPREYRTCMIRDAGTDVAAGIAV
ncbi:helix-turn-helix domain-containing protein [Streptomyces sp. NPDC002143]